jgi:hypothetical protein
MRAIVDSYIVYGYLNSRLFQKKFIFIAKNKDTQFSSINVYIFPSTTKTVPYVGGVEQRMKTLRECEALDSLRDRLHFLGTIKSLSLGNIWNFSKGTGLP